MARQVLEVGQLVRSKAGRDCGRFFLVVGVADERTVALADGDLRGISRPKLKNVRHLEVFPVRLKEAEARLAVSRVVTEKAVAEAIRELLTELGLATSPSAAARGELQISSDAGGRQAEEDSRGYGQERRD
jgi:large subunit ribosomal protein L14e